MIYIYRLIVPFIYIGLLVFRPWLGSKIRVGLSMRKKTPSGQWPWLALPRNQKPIWIHCSSGEFEYAKPVITEIKKSFPSEKILVTYFSPTYRTNIERFPGVDFSCPLPFDLPGACRDFLDHHQPKAWLISRTDLWPEMLHQARRRKIPSLLFSATFKPKDDFIRWAERIFDPRKAMVDRIFVVSPKDEANAPTHLRDKIQVMGDTRYDQVLARLEDPKPTKPISKMDDRKTLIAGSTWEKDESVLLDATEDLLKNQILRLILVPHEPTEDHMKGLVQQVLSRGLSVETYSELDTEPPKADVLVIDKVGLLAELYLQADIGFVGGSFQGSVHSVMEALGAGLPTIVGPHHLNNREALEFKSIRSPSSGQAYLYAVKDAKELKDVLKRLSNESLVELGYEITKEVTSRAGASLKVVEALGLSKPFSQRIDA